MSIEGLKKGPYEYNNRLTAPVIAGSIDTVQ